ncbi:MAG TPA: histidine kinase [Streptosporangiaceae bacterium]|nr:histidine kinase [Streptosporangiaceae bacterium]
MPDHDLTAAGPPAADAPAAGPPTAGPDLRGPAGAPPPRGRAILRTPAARRWATDALIAAAVTAVQLSVAGRSWHQDQASLGAIGYLPLAIGGAALVARRRFPVTVLAITLVTALWAAAAGATMTYLALIVAFFTAVLARKRAAAIGSLVIGYLVSCWPPWLIGARGHASAGFALGLAAGLFALLAVAELIRGRMQRAADLARSRDEQLLRRAGEERMRIARDLHDVLAHNIAVINVQANTALHLMDRQPERARSALSTINDVSKQALVELRSVLGVLREAGEDPPRAPAPGLARLGDLVENAAAAGLAVSIETSGEPVPLPAEADLAAYRIIQEALTNSARHSGGSRAVVRLGYGDGRLDIEVTDDGAARPASRPGGPGGAGSPGNGITGMTERATALGGTLRAAARPGGGFAVTARLPVPARDGQAPAAGGQAPAGGGSQAPAGGGEP